MAKIGIETAETLLRMLCSSDGLTAAITDISLRENRVMPEIGGQQVFAENVPAELAEKEPAFRYPALFVYCDRVVNSHREKFRTFAGAARLVVEVRVSGERRDGLEHDLQLYVDAVTEVLHNNRGDWGQGIGYSGAYEVQFGSVKRGGRSYIQTAKVVLEVDVSCS